MAGKTADKIVEVRESSAGELLVCLRVLCRYYKIFVATNSTSMSAAALLMIHLMEAEMETPKIPVAAPTTSPANQSAGSQLPASEPAESQEWLAQG